MLVQNKRRGDTLIEVLFATATFSLLAVSSIAIMNSGIATSQRALEITLVRNEIDAQAEALRFLNSSYIAAYNSNGALASDTPARKWYDMSQDIITVGATSASAFGAVNGACPDLPNGSFILNPKKALYHNSSVDIFDSPKTFSQLVYDDSSNITSAQGLWIEGVRSNTIPGDQEHAGYIDFHIRACWFSEGQSVPVTIGTIVRLYEPR